MTVTPFVRPSGVVFYAQRKIVVKNSLAKHFRLHFQNFCDLCIIFVPVYEIGRAQSYFEKRMTSSTNLCVLDVRNDAISFLRRELNKVLPLGLRVVPLPI